MARLSLANAGSKALSVAASSSLVVTMMMVPGMAQTATTPNEPQAVAGDLSHLVYTAEAGLTARAISPDDGGVVNALATAFEVATVAGAGVELAVNGLVIPAKKLGRRAELENGSLRYTYYGVLLGPGSNTVVITPLGANGLRGPSVTEHVWGPGAPAAIHMTGCLAPRADGRTACALNLAVVDEWGHPAVPGATLKAEIASGDALIRTAGITGGELVANLEPASAPTTAGQRSVAVVVSTGSTVILQIVPGTTPGRIAINASAGAASGAVGLSAMAFGRDPIVTGLATIGVGAVPGESGTDPTAADGTNSRLGRVALYGTGTLSGNAVASLAYDTAGSLAATTSTGSLNDDPNDRPYATYGDSSTRRNDALTQDRLYARIDDNFNSLMWGEFQATTGPEGTTGAVAMQVDGAKVALGSASTTVSAFTANNKVGYGRQLLSPTGLAVLDTLLHDNLVVGSETVTLVSVDRRTGVVINQTVLQNVVDYTIDYTAGRIRFINVPLPYDALFNPQQILVTYEYSAIDGGAKTTGARFDAPLTRFDGIKFGLGYLNDDTGTSNFTLLSQNASGWLQGGSWSLSHASSNGVVPGAGDLATGGGTNGSALRLVGSSASGPYKLAFGYDSTSAGYGNPFGDVATPGMSDYHATLLRAFGGQNGDLALSFEHTKSDALSATDGSLSGTSQQSTISAIVHEKLTRRLTVDAGLTMHTSDTRAAVAGPSSSPAPSPTGPNSLPTAAPDSSPVQSASVMQAVAGVDWEALRHLHLSAERDQSVGGFDTTDPAQTTAQASLDLNGLGRLYARELLSDSPVASYGSLAGVGSAAHAFALGIEEKINPNTLVDSEYAVSETGNATDITAAIGVKEHVRFSKDLKGDAFVQRGIGVGAVSSSFLVYGLSLAYGDPRGRMKATGSLQDRTGAGGGATWSLGAAGKLFGDFSLVASDQGSRALGSDTTDAHVALAWRPSTSDRGALFVGYQRVAGNADVAGAQSGVISLDGQYRPFRRLELTGRYARKTDGDSNYAVGTSLIGLGLRQQLTPRYDVGIETRAVLAPSAGGGLHSTAAEFGSMVGSTLRVALGYNLGTTADPTLAAAPTRKGIYATVTTVIDRIFGWGAH